ncbi:MAG: tetratricopeptide repeat protein, partial [Chloroflexi bacterium]|nr:tetratricopeptide repeat protein [Chloroflexota bacterium]
VTSRAPLQVAGEREFPVAPLALPSLTPATTLAQIASAPAVMLFVERAVAIRPDFALTETNAVTVAAICTRLDGLPLAIELAAARSRLLPPEALLRHLGEGLSFLVGGRRDAPARQRTLRDTIAWSYDLLPPSEQQLFRQLSVFVGGFTLAAAAAVCGADREPVGIVLDGIESLIANSLLLSADTAGGEPRHRMLETIREFGLEMLGASGESTRLSERHLAWCLDLAEQFSRHVGGPDYDAWLPRIDAEYDNILAALRWSGAAASDPERGLRIVGRLGDYWSLRGKAGEGRAWASGLLTRTTARTEARAMALGTAGYLATRQGDYEAGRAWLEESLAIRREIADPRQITRALRHLSLVWHHLGDYQRARALLEEGLLLPQQTSAAREYFLTLRFLADLHFDSAAYAEAASLYERCLVWAEANREVHETGYAQRGLGNVARAQGNYPQARQLLRASIASLASLGDRRCTPICLEGLACIEVGPNWAERATRLFGAAQALQEQTGQRPSPVEMADYQLTEADARTELGEARYRAIWSHGAAMSLDEAVAYALADERAVDPATARRDTVSLTPREREIVALIAGGLSNREIATRLVLSVRTVERHIENVYNRLGITGKAGRAIVTAYALRHRLVRSP